MTNKNKPEKVKKILCPKCGELMIKIYPWSSISYRLPQVPSCNKCKNSTLKSGVA